MHIYRPVLDLWTELTLTMDRRSIYNLVMTRSNRAATGDVCRWSQTQTRFTGGVPRIAYRAAMHPVSGDTSPNPPLVLLHSLAVDQSTWAPVAEILDRDHRVITIDTRGHGDSASAGSAGPAEWSADIISVLDALEIDKALLVGVSMGGIQAGAAAAAAAERVTGIVVADSFAALPAKISAARIAGLSEYAATHPMDQVADKYVDDTFVAAHADARGRELVRRSISAMGHGDYLCAVAACFGADIRAELANVVVPALVLWGELDQKTPRALSEAIATGIPEAHLKVVPGAAHLSHLDQPEVFASLVSEFAARV